MTQFWTNKQMQIMRKEMYEKGKKDNLEEVKKIVSKWYDVSIKDRNSNLALMVSNGGYINKLDLLKELERIIR